MLTIGELEQRLYGSFLYYAYNSLSLKYLKEGQKEKSLEDKVGPREKKTLTY